MHIISHLSHKVLSDPYYTHCKHILMRPSEMLNVKELDSMSSHSAWQIFWRS